MRRWSKLFRLPLVGLFLLAETSGLAQIVSFRDATKAEMEEALSAIQQGDYPKALQNFERAQAIIDAAKNAHNTTENQQARTAIPYLIGKTKADGKLGDPCPSFAKAQMEMKKLLNTFEKSLREDRFPLDTMISDLKDAQAANGCVKSKPAVAVKDVSGRYYLSGVREVGSEVRLSEDGRYEWYMSYGAVDQFSNGNWAVVGRDVVLTHFKPAAGTPLFKPRGIDAWNMSAENQVLRDIHAAEVDLVFKACPFQTDIDPSDATVAPPIAPSMPVVDDPAPKPDPEVELKNAQLNEKAARKAYERAAAAAMRPGKDADWRHGVARGARYEWLFSYNLMIRARQNASIPPGELVQPILPKQCIIPDEPRAQDIPEAQWKRGVAVVVSDPELGLNFQNIDVTFHFANGTHVDSKTDRRGFAWTEKRAGNTVTAVSFNYRGANRDGAKPERFAIEPASEGVLPVEIQSRQFTDPPFDVMRLPITGKGTLGGPRGRGRYTRQ